jgi:hypothetical protein
MLYIYVQPSDRPDAAVHGPQHQTNGLTFYPLVHWSSLETSHPFILSGRLFTVASRQRSTVPPRCSSRRPGIGRWPVSPLCPSTVAHLPRSIWRLLPTVAFSSVRFVFSTEVTRHSLLHRSGELYTGETHRRASIPMQQGMLH